MLGKQFNKATWLRGGETVSDLMAGKVAIVTGGASGIGAATARLFSREGAVVIVSDIQDALGEAVARDCANAVYVRADVTREAEVEALVSGAAARFGRLDCMVNNAGAVGAVGSIMDTSDDNWRRTMAVLLDSVFYGMKHAARVMVPQKDGCILSLSSIAGVMGALGPHVYTAAKHGVIGLTKSVAFELAPHGIRVNAVAPGTTATPLVAGARGGSIEAAEQGAADTSPLGRAIMPHDIASALLYLASDLGRNVNAHTLVVDGGRTTASTPGGPGPTFHKAAASYQETPKIARP
jgi:NAD(P)-dependent dehydrogenase (short-subunit alcohol dehydrogenase family)